MTAIKEFLIPNIRQFEKKLRILEYYHNCRKDPIGKLFYIFKKLCFQRYSQKLGFTIPINVFGPGLCICHVGTIVVNENARIGSNARIHIGVNIGNSSTLGEGWVPDNVPQIGNNVYIGPGAKLFGRIKIGENVAIGANAVVNQDVPDNVTVAGVPAKIISQKPSNVIHGDSRV